MEIILVDGLTQERTSTTIDNLVAMSGLAKKTVMSKIYGRKFFKSLNCFAITDKESMAKVKEMLSSRLKYSDYEDEVWRKSPLTNDSYLVSNLGRVKKVESNGLEKILIHTVRQAKKKTENRLSNTSVVVKIKAEDGRYKPLPLKRLVFSAFSPSTYKCGNNIIHKDRSFQNCSFGNLKIVSDEDLGLLVRLSKSQCKYIIRCDQATLKPIEIYTSQQIACDVMKVASIRRALDNFENKEDPTSVIRGYRFKRVDSISRVIEDHPNIQIHTDVVTKRIRELLS